MPSRPYGQTTKHGVSHHEAPSGSTLISYGILGVLALVPVIALSIYSYGVASAAIQEHIAASNLTAASITKELVQHDLQHWISTLVGFSQSRGVVLATRNRDEETLRRRLKVLVESQREVVRAFVTDPTGLLWTDYPRAPESLGKRFDHRDWYEGVTESWTPYVSEVYRRHAEPKPLLVAIAAPIFDETSDDAIGIVVKQVRLEGLTRQLQKIEVGRNGYAFLLDESGIVAAHPQLDLQQRRYAEYESTPPIRAALEGKPPSTISYVDPFVGEPMLAAALQVRVGERQWIVVAQQPEQDAYETISVVRRQIGAGGVMFTLIAGMLCIGLARYHNRIRDMNVTLDDLNRDLTREITKRQNAEEALQQSHDRLEERVEERTRQLRDKEEQLRHAQKLEAIGRLAAGVAHDFNNLLSVILGYTEIRLEELPSDDDMNSELEEIHHAGEQAALLTSQLLAFGRKQMLRPAVLNLNDIIRRLVKMLRRVIGEHIQLETDLDPDVPNVKVDAGQIEQVLMNLAVNARDAMPEGGTLTIRTKRIFLDGEYVEDHADVESGLHVMLAMIDTGEGMDEETQSKIFEPFFTTKPTDKGTGLGLPTVYGIVKQSGGHIWVYSEPGGGATFKIYFPAVADDIEPAAPERSRPESLAGTETILVVEDNARVRRLVQTILESQGYQLLVACDGDQATQAAATFEGNIDLLLTDVVLPDYSGVELAANLQTSRPELRIVFTSGYAQDTIEDDGQIDGNSTFVEKPFGPRTLLEAVREALSG